MKIEPKSPSESFLFDGRPTGFTVGQFWQWAMSDLSGNTGRSIVVEFIVANA